MKISTDNPVVIFGRTNVGKSTLFNCLTEKKKALVSMQEGTTRDSNIGQVEWNRLEFKLVDTGGIMDIGLMTESRKKRKQATTDIDVKVQRQARDYLEKAAVILFLVNAQDGLLPTDKAMAQSLMKIIADKAKIILVANKADSPKWRRETAEFNQLGLGEPLAISAVTGSGTGDLLDEVVKLLKKTAKEEKTKAAAETTAKDETINIIMVGKPNVGKSSLLNALTGEERVIVSPIAHTTREPQDTILEYKGRTFRLIDTAGISKQGQKIVRRSKLKQSLERQSILSSLSGLKQADVALLVVDTNDGLAHQEAKLVEEILEAKTSLIIVANKWDLIEKRDEDDGKEIDKRKEYTEIIYDRLPFVTWAPIQFVSAKNGKKVNKLLDLAIRIADERRTVVGQNGLDKFLHAIVKKQRPVKRDGVKPPHIFELKQADTNPPIFGIRIGSKDSIAYAYVRFIENRLREKFGFFGTPITVYVERNKRVHGKAE